MVAVAPPAIGPERGVTDVIAGVSRSTSCTIIPRRRVLLPPSGLVPVTVTNPDGGSSTLLRGMIVHDVDLETPAITSVTPRSGPIAGGATATIHGAGFS